jgi:hypothetical protein
VRGEHETVPSNYRSAFRRRSCGQDYARCEVQGRGGPVDVRHVEEERGRAIFFVVLRFEEGCDVFLFRIADAF